MFFRVIDVVVIDATPAVSSRGVGLPYMTLLWRGAIILFVYLLEP